MLEITGMLESQEMLDRKQGETEVATGRQEMLPKPGSSYLVVESWAASAWQGWGACSVLHWL